MHTKEDAVRQAGRLADGKAGEAWHGFSPNNITGHYVNTSPNGHTNGSVQAAGQDYFDRLIGDATVELEPQAEPVRRFPFLSFKEATALPPKQWMIDQIIGQGDLGMVYGAPGSGKTFVVIDLIFSACLGKPFAGRFATSRQLTVAYAAGEGMGGLSDRLTAAAAYYAVDDLPGFTLIPDVPQLFDENAGGSIFQFVNEWKVNVNAPLDLLIIDTLHAATVGANENDARDMGRAMAAAKYAAKELGCAVILVHHSNKAGTGERGSTSMRGSMDVMIEVKEVGGGRLMVCEKLKDGQRWQPQTFDLVAKDNSVRVEWGDAGETKKADSAPGKLVAVLREYPGKRFTAKSLAEATGLGPTQTTTALNRLTEKGEVKRELEDASKPNSNRNPWLYWVDADS